MTTAGGRRDGAPARHAAAGGGVPWADPGPGDAGVVARTVDALVVGAGPAGLAAAARLAASGAGRVEVLDRERTAGGIPRHCLHGGFGPRAPFTALTGPGYARLLVDEAVRAGAGLRTGITVTGWAGPRTLETTGPQGRERVTARVVVLATGARERPRAARLVPGTRPAGVLTTGELQQAVNLHGARVGTRAVVVGTGAIAAAAVLALTAGGAETVAVVAEDSYRPLPTLRRRIPVLAMTTVTELLGRGRLSGVRVRHRDGRTATIACDTVVFTGDWIPEHELARLGGVPLDPGTRGPSVDTGFHTAVPGVLAAGNLLHGVERAHVAAAEGRAAAGVALRHLAGAPWPGPGLPLRTAGPLLWIAPGRIHPHGPAPLHDRFILRASRPLGLPRLTVTQNGRLLHRRPVTRPVHPGRPLRLRAGWMADADPDGGELLIEAVPR
ncbi:FAD-dependent oxidoreductase [Streptomyces sp. CAU 1734]|uniref:NAD(P)/FAD-dependent oxidoreductase n=1 Tax=Streptomyces sp. CAU 1734 TaxID=3140360 RepID=UPI0032619A0C